MLKIINETNFKDYIKNGLKHYSLKPFFGIIIYFLDVYTLNATAPFFIFV